MKKTALFAGLILAGLASAACTNGQTSQQATLSNGQRVAEITPAIRAALRAQGLDPDEEVCKRDDEIGSVIPKRTCATRAMWAARSGASQQYTSDIQRDALRTRAPGS